MSHLAALLEEALSRRVELSVTPTGNLRWRCRGPLPEDLRLRLVEHKAALVVLLAESQRLLAELRGELAIIERRDFARRFPRALANLLADCLAVAESYAAAGRLEELKGYRPWMLEIIERAKKTRTNS